MKIKQLHHVSIVTADLERAALFYQDVLGLQPLPRPPFTVGRALAEPFEPFTFTPARASVCQLEIFGTARKKLKALTLGP